MTLRHPAAFAGAIGGAADRRLTGVPLGQASPLLRAGGQGALVGWAAGGVYGEWVVLLGEDFRHRLFRLAAERLSFASLTGAVLGALLALLLFLLLDALKKKGRGCLTLGAGILAALDGLLVILAALPLRDFFFPLHQFSDRLLSVAVFAALALLLTGLVLGRIRAAMWADAAASSPGAAALAGWSALTISLLVQFTIPRLPLPKGVTGRPIIIVSLDTLRGDRLGCMGYPRPVSPRLDSLAREGMVFERATAAAPWTLPSHASLFTSLLPFNHGALTENRPLRPGHSTLAERLRNAGYRTAAFTGGAYVAAGFGFGQGFEIYEDHDEGIEGGPEGIAGAALAWSRSVKDAPFFLFVHTYVVHFPYTHTDFVDPSSGALQGKIFNVKELDAVHHGRRVLTPAERRWLSDLYDGDVACADRVMGGMLETMRREGVLDRAVLVVLSDHGEDLWNHDSTRSPGHGHSLYQELLHVPLIVRAPGTVRPAARIHTPVSLLDLVPTLLELAGVPGEAADAGRSLVPTLSSGREPEELPILAESAEYGPDRFARIEGSLKVILTPMPQLFNGGTPIEARPLEMFDLSSDPGETHDLSGVPPRGASRITENLWKRVETVFKPLAESGGRGKIPEALRDQLRSLGYVQ